MNGPPIQLKVFGPFSACQADGSEVQFQTKSVAGICAYLALRPGGWITREELADTFWPDTTSRGALRTALHRARDAFGGYSPFEFEEDRVKLSANVETDLERSRSVHKRYLLCANVAESADLLWEEWRIVQNEVLSGWPDDWIGPIRLQWTTYMAEHGCELARRLEASGNTRAALPVVRQILSEIPHHADALELAMRLEFELNGPVQALEHLRIAKLHLLDMPELGLPKSVIALGRSIQEDSYQVVPPSENFADRSAVALLGHLFESNLKSNRSEALSTLASEAYSPICMRHPETTLALLLKALELTEGTAPERIAVVEAALTFAEYLSDCRTGDELTDFLIQTFPPESRAHNGALSMKGSFFMEEGRYEESRKFFQRGIDGSVEPTRRAVALAMLSMLDYCEMHLDSAEQGLRSAFDALEQSDRPDKGRNQAGILLNLAHVELSRSQWQNAYDYAQEASTYAAKYAAPIRVMSFAPAGLAQVMAGEAKSGLSLLATSVTESYKEGLPRTHRQALDCAAIAFHRLGRPRVCYAVLEATGDLRARFRHPRSRADVALIEGNTGLNLAFPSESGRVNPLRLQSVPSLSLWVADELRLTK